MTSRWRLTAHGGLMAIWAGLAVAFLMRDTHRINHASYFRGHFAAPAARFAEAAANQDQHQHVGQARLRNRQ